MKKKFGVCHLNSTLWPSQSFYLILFDSSLCVSLSVVSNSFATPWTVTPQVSLSVGFSRQGYWSGLPCPPPGALPHPGMEPCSPALQAVSLPSEGFEQSLLLFTGLLLCLYCAHFLSRQRWPPQRSGTAVEEGIHRAWKTLETPLDCKEIQPVHSEGDQPWDFFGRNDAKAETPVLWPPHAKS